MDVWTCWESSVRLVECIDRQRELVRSRELLVEYRLVFRESYSDLWVWIGRHLDLKGVNISSRVSVSRTLVVPLLFLVQKSRDCFVDGIFKQKWREILGGVCLPPALNIVCESRPCDRPLLSLDMIVFMSLWWMNVWMMNFVCEIFRNSYELGEPLCFEIPWVTNPQSEQA